MQAKNAWEMTRLEYLQSHYRIAGQPVPRFYTSREVAQEAKRKNPLITEMVGHTKHNLQEAGQ